jgi:cyclophilin family peptidyl-prolyl cis-trans isomerase
MHKVFFIAMVISLLSIGGYWYAHHISLASPVAEPVSFGSIGAKETKNPDIINNPKIMNATLHTNKGDIKLEFSSLTPNTVANFIKLSKSGFYDGVKFHRVISGFMIQAGDPLSKDDTKKDEWGTGGPGYRFEDEIAEGNSNIIGSVAMANAGPDTNGSQFFINTADNHFLDDKHTVFAHVIEGMDVVKMIESIPKDEKDRPLEPVIIENITL